MRPSPDQRVRKETGTVVIRSQADVCAAQFPVDLWVEVADCTHLHIHKAMCTRQHAHTHCRHPSPPFSCPWAWQSGHGRYQREGEAWKQKRPSLWLRSACSSKSAFVGGKMAMSEQLEAEGGKSSFTSSPSFRLQEQNRLRSNKSNSWRICHSLSVVWCVRGLLFVCLFVSMGYFLELCSTSLATSPLFMTLTKVD